MMIRAIWRGPNGLAAVVNFSESSVEAAQALAAENSEASEARQP